MSIYTISLGLGAACLAGYATKKLSDWTLSKATDYYHKTWNVKKTDQFKPATIHIISTIFSGLVAGTVCTVITMRPGLIFSAPKADELEQEFHILPIKEEQTPLIR